MSEWIGSELDGLTDNQAIMRLEAEFPRWHCYRGVDGLCHARSHDPVSRPVRGEDWTDLRDMVIGQVWREQGWTGTN
jgi:hypothetical protein